MSDEPDDEDRNPSPAPVAIRRRGEKTGPKTRISESDAIALVRPMQAAIARASEQERRARREARITDLIGHDGCGGSFEELEASVQAIKNDVAELKVFKAKILLLGTIGTAIGGVVVGVVMKILDKFL